MFLEIVLEHSKPSMHAFTWKAWMGIRLGTREVPNCFIRGGMHPALSIEAGSVLCIIERMRGRERSKS
jgi:hypothetical protein